MEFGAQSDVSKRLLSRRENSEKLLPYANVWRAQKRAREKKRMIGEGTRKKNAAIGSAVRKSVAIYVVGRENVHMRDAAR